MLTQLKMRLADWLAGKPAAARRGKWPAVEKAHLAKQPVCQACGRKKHLQVHHIRPFHLHPELELDDSNLITLCMDGPGIKCHFALGHGGNWHWFNPDVIHDAKWYLETTENSIDREP